ncbi:unnamed protein product [Pylaiella littoralis]
MTNGSVTSSLGGLSGRGAQQESSSHHNINGRKGRSRSRSRSRRRDGDGGRDRSRRRSGSRDRRRSRSRSRHNRSGDRRNGVDRAATTGGGVGGGGSGSNANELAARALLKSIAGGIGAAPAGRGRGRGSTMPAWMTHPGGPGGLQESSSGSKAVGGVDLKERSSPPRFTRSSQPLPPEPTMTDGGIAGRGGGRGWERNGGGRYGSGGGRGGGRGGDRGNGRRTEPLPAVFSVHKGEVVKTETFGAFVKLDGYRKHGLVHCSQMASYRVEDVTDICKAGDTVFVKVIEVTEGAEPREQRIALSMKMVNQADGTDLDPSNAEAETDLQRRKPTGGSDRAPVKLEAVFNTTCTKCGVQGHLSIDCFSRGGKKYDLVDEEDPRDAPVITNGGGGGRGDGGGGMRGVYREPPRGAVGRGVGATMPAWMTDLGLADKLGKKSHRKEKKSKKTKSDRHRRSHREGDGSGSSDSDSESDANDRDKKRSKKHHKSGKHHKSSKHKKHHDKRSNHSKHASGKKRHSSRRQDDGSGSSSEEEGGIYMNGADGGGDSRGKGYDNASSGGQRSRSRYRSSSREHRSGDGGAGRRGRSRSRNRGGSGVFRTEDRGRFADAEKVATHMGDGGRWRPRGDSDRSNSRSTR